MQRLLSLQYAVPGLILVKKDTYFSTSYFISVPKRSSNGGFLKKILLLAWENNLGLHKKFFLFQIENIINDLALHYTCPTSQKTCSAFISFLFKGFFGVGIERMVRIKVMGKYGSVATGKIRTYEPIIKFHE